MLSSHVMAHVKDEPAVEVNIDELLGALDKKLDRCKHLYDQYFLGFEKRPPSILHKEIVRLMHDIDQIDIRKAGPLFRYHSLIQRWGVYRTMWNREIREIELGTSKRDLARMARKWKSQGKDDKTLRRVRTPAQLERVIEQQLSHGAPEPGPSFDRIHELFDQYVSARQSAGERAEPPHYEAFEKRIRKQIPELVAKGAKSVDFRVAIKDGRAIVQAVVKK